MHLDLDSRFLCQVKQKGTVSEFTNLYRRICMSVRSIKDPEAAIAEAKQLARCIKDIDMSSIWDAVPFGAFLDLQDMKTIQEN